MTPASLFLYKQKSPDLSIETALLFSSTFIKRWFQPFSLHATCLTNSFVCNFLSSSAGFNLCSCFFPAHPCLPLSLPTVSGPSIPLFSQLPFRFLTPSVFHILSDASVSGSDYSAFRLSFPFFPISPDGGSFGALRFLSSPSPSSSVRLVSTPLFRFRYSASCNSFLRLLFRLTVATSAPQPSSFRLPAAPLGFRFRFGYLAQASSPQGHSSVSRLHFATAWL